MNDLLPHVFSRYNRSHILRTFYFNNSNKDDGLMERSLNRKILDEIHGLVLLIGAAFSLYTLSLFAFFMFMILHSLHDIRTELRSK